MIIEHLYLSQWEEEMLKISRIGIRHEKFWHTWRLTRSNLVFLQPSGNMRLNRFLHFGVNYYLDQLEKWVTSNVRRYFPRNHLLKSSVDKVITEKINQSWIR